MVNFLHLTEEQFILIPLLNYWIYFLFWYTYFSNSCLTVLNLTMVSTGKNKIKRTANDEDKNKVCVDKKKMGNYLFFVCKKRRQSPVVDRDSRSLPDSASFRLSDRVPVKAVPSSRIFLTSNDWRYIYSSTSEKWKSWKKMQQHPGHCFKRHFFALGCRSPRRTGMSQEHLKVVNKSVKLWPTFRIEQNIDKSSIWMCQ